jgi:hypothetical protein
MLKRTFAAYLVQDIERKIDLKFEQAILPEKAIRFISVLGHEIKKKCSNIGYVFYFPKRIFFNSTNIYVLFYFVLF